MALPDRRQRLPRSVEGRCGAPCRWTLRLSQLVNSVVVMPTGGDVGAARPGQPDPGRAVIRRSARCRAVGAARLHRCAATPRSPATSGAHPARRAAGEPRGRIAPGHERRREQHAPPGPAARHVDATRHRARPPPPIANSSPPTSTPSSATTSTPSSPCCGRTMPSSRCRRSNCGCKAPTTSAAGCSPLTPSAGALTPVNANGSPAVAVYRPPTPGGQPTVSHPGARQHRRAHRRHSRLPGPGAVRPVRPALPAS